MSANDPAQREADGGKARMLESARTARDRMVVTWLADGGFRIGELCGLHSATDDAAGQIGLWTHDHRHGRASVGYWVAPQQRRRGFATAALHTVSRWGLTLDGIARLELYVEPWNEGSWKAAERVGFQREGLLRSWEAVGEQRRDMFIFSLLRGEQLD